MKKMIVTLLLAILSLSAIAQTSKAQATNAQLQTETMAATKFVPPMSYQGLITDKSGNALTNGEYDVEFKLFNSAEKGETVWSEVQKIKIEDGVINAVLGLNKKVELPFDQQYWLSVTVNKEEMPRQILTASPYVAGNSVKTINGATGDVEIVGGNGISVEKGKDGKIVIGGDGAGIDKVDGAKVGSVQDYIRMGITERNYDYVRLESNDGSVYAGGLMLNKNAASGFGTLNAFTLYSYGLNRDLVLKSSGKTLVPDGNVGIGTNDPKAKLDVAGAIKAGGAVILYEDNSATPKEKIGFSVAPSELQIYGGGTGTNRISFGKFGTSFTSQMTLTQYGHLGIGTTNPESKLTVDGDIRLGEFGKNQWILHAPPTGTALCIAPRKADGSEIWKSQVVIHNDGKVVIGNGVDFFGTPYDNAQLTVNGKIAAEEIVVVANVASASGSKDDGKAWPDYVFSPDYKMMSLDQVEDFIETNNHLPGVPSAAEIGRTGIRLGDMQRVYMEKIEELTLHLIEQNKKIDALEKRLNGTK